MSVLVLAVVVVAIAGVWIAGKSLASATPGHPASAAEGSLASGFHAPDRATYYSSQVVEPDPETWTDVRPSGEYRVMLLAQGRDAHTAHDPQVATLVDAVKRWARDEDRVSLTVRYLGDPHTSIDAIDHAARSKTADLIVVAGNGLVDPVAVVSANYAGENPQQFLVLGAEVAEPTTNITATDWVGSAYLGEGVPEADYYDPASVTAPRAYAALRAGAAAVLSGYTGVIVRIPVDRY
ncbi:hypothetical protein LK09_15030 [Microbacterium mangrovi]|uniref:BMP family ABC transporter substrate-binding protein n=1 Tax=Microbacterium mangrovi TaxID=1348253 RepID=A0A0B2A0W3_9MICO|nr:hypothetical protein LK09_15030 [Microbacterium mangrovi]